MESGTGMALRKKYGQIRNEGFAGPGLLVLASLILGSPLATADVIAQWQGGNYSNSGSYPPDMGGAVGDGYVMQMLNGYVATFNTSGTFASPATSLNSFWSALGTNVVGTSVSDPRVIYDPASQRWFASAISTQSTSNNILLAVSNTSNPSAGFNEFSIAAAANNFADFPTLAVNNNAITIGVNNFSALTGNPSGESVYSIPKTSLLAAIPSLTSYSSFTTTSRNGFTPQGVTNFYGTGTNSLVLSNTENSDGLYVSAVNNSAVAGATINWLNTSFTSVLGTAPTNPTQPGGTTYDAGDNRISSGVYEVGNLVYFANTVSVNGSDQIQWGILNVTTNTIQTGLISAPNLDLTYPSISANSNGTFVISFNGSGSASNIGAYYVVCSTGTNSCSTPTEDFAGLSGNYSNISSYNNRWGDYSWTTVDPNNLNDFWLFQEVPLTNSWGTTITEVATVNVPELNPGSGAVALALLLGGLVLVSDRRRTFSV